MNEKAKIRLIIEVKKSLKEIMDDFSDVPEEMGYFYERFRAFFEETPNNGKKVIATMCIHVPVELIYAVGAIPLRVCSGARSMAEIGEEFFPAKACPLIKSTFGALYLNIFPMAAAPAMIINPTTCDHKKKIGEMAEDIDSCFYTLELPPTKETEEARFYWHMVVKKLAKELERVTGQRLTRKKLKAAIGIVSLAQAQLRRLYNIRKGNPVIWGNNAILVANAYFFDDIANWTDRLSRLNDELEDRARRNQYVVGQEAPRILLAGSPSIFPNMTLPVMIEQMGGIVVAEEFCSSSRSLYDMVAVDEWSLYDMIPAIADRYLKPGICPCFTPNIDRKRRLLNIAGDFCIDGVIYNSFAGCQLYQMESRHVEKILEQNGIPMLYLETDYTSDNTGQLTTRLQAFMELLQDQKS